MTPGTMQALTVGAILFVLGLIGFLSRRNMILMFLSLEMMLAGISTNFIAFGHHFGNFHGQVFAIMILTVASCEAALALSLVVALYRRSPTLDIRVWSNLRELPQSDASLKSVADELRENAKPEETEAPLPHLTPAGRDPMIDPMHDRLKTEILSPKA